MTISARLSRRLTALLILGSFGACNQTPVDTNEADTESAPEAIEVPKEDPAQEAPELAAPQAGEDSSDRQVRSSSFDFSPGGPISDDQLGEYHVLMQASIDGEDAGQMAFAFWPEKAPITVRNFLRLVDRGFYDGLTFHRVLRDFMVQGGCVLGNGMGQSPLGMIKGEFSDDPKWYHRYGVLSMARSGNPDSGGSQFFLINDDGSGAWSLDGEYASFGRMTQGVATLEALSNVKVTQDPRGEPSVPIQKLLIESARVIAGPAPSGETIERPGAALDLGGRPERVQVHSMLIGYKSSFSKATRTREEAASLAAQLLERLQAGEDFDALSKEFSDDPVQVMAAEELGHIGFHILNEGVRDRVGERKVFDMQQSAQEQMKSMNVAHQRGEVTRQELQEESQGLQRMFKEQLRLKLGYRVQMLGPQAIIGETALEMELGQTKIVPYDATRCREGWYLLRRVK